MHTLDLENWSPAVEVGMANIDDQHRQLFDLAATFRGNRDQIRVMKSLVMLCDYARTHLRDEEAMLEAIAYPELEAHRQHHAFFRQQLKDLLAGAGGMTLDQIADAVERLINGWFYKHILEIDLEYVPYLRQGLNH